MVFENEINIFNPDAIANEFHTQSTQISAVQGKIGAIISDSQIQELQNGGFNLYSRLVSAEMDINGISTQVSSLRQVDGQLESQISTVRQTANSISLEVSSVKSGYAKKSQIIMAINNTTQESETIINAEHISLAGKTIKLTTDNIAISSTNFSVDKYGNMVARAGTFSGTIKGANITLGGASNANGWVEILNASGQRVGRWDNSGQYVGNIVSSLSNPNTKIGTNGAITTKSLTANDYIHVDGNANSIIKIPYTNITNGGSIELSTTGLKLNADNSNKTYIKTAAFTVPSGTLAGTYGAFDAVYNISPGNYAEAYLCAGAIQTNYIINNNNSAYTRIEPGWLSIFDSTGNVRGELTFGARNGLVVTAPATLNGALTVNGTKSRLVKTKDYGDRILYSYETPSPMFGDVGEGIISLDGKCYVQIDGIFAETVTLIQYQVFLQKYGDGECWVSERKGSFFIVEGTPGLAFGWEIKAKQSDFDQLRLEKDTEKMEIDNAIDYTVDLAKHIYEIQREREVAA